MSGRRVGGLSGTLLSRLKAPPRVGRRVGGARLPPLLVFLATSVMLHWLLVPDEIPYDRDSTIAAKQYWYSQVAPEVDLIFVGTSRVYRGVDPAMFDAMAAARGVPLRSLNLAVPRLQGFELESALDRFLEHADERLKWVVIDPGSFTGMIFENNHATTREVAWHTPVMTARALARLTREDMPAPEIAQFAREHLEAALLRYAWVGGYSQRLLGNTGPPPPAFLLEHMGADLNGYLALDSYGPEHANAALYASRHDLFVAGLDAYQQRLSDLVDARQRPTPRLGDDERRFLSKLVERIESAGAQPIFFVAAGEDDDQLYLRAAFEEGVIDSFLDYGDPERYPEIFEPASRFDESHLSRRGGLRLTELLADDLLKQIAGVP